MRALSFLGAAARPHYAAVAAIVARAVGEPAPAIEEPGLDRLAEAVADPRPALVFLCGLPYVRLRDLDAPVEALAAPVPDEPGTPEARGLLQRRGRAARRAAARVVPRRIQQRRLALRLGAAAIRARGPRRAALGAHRQPPAVAGAARRGGDRRGADRLLRPAPRAAASTRRSAAFELRQRIGPMPAPPVVAFGGGADAAARDADGAARPAAHGRGTPRARPRRGAALRAGHVGDVRAGTGAGSGCGRRTVG